MTRVERQSKRVLPFIVISISMAFVFAGERPDAIAILSPALPDSISYDQGKLVIASVAKEDVPELVVSTQWETVQYLDVSPQVSRQNFPRDFYRLFDTTATLQRIVYNYRFFGGTSAPDSIVFPYADSVTIRTLWSMPVLAKFAQDVQNPEVLGVILSISGWKDSTYIPVYDDPAADGRALFKIPVQLIPGANSIYLSAAGRRGQALAYSTNFTAGYQSIEERGYHFHNSDLEQGCVTCHEGLPSADSGMTMTADCGVCHTAFQQATFIHAPAEMKECGACHTWSPEKKLFAAAKPVPDLCYDCHEEKKALVDSAAVQHPVAGECLTCHSPHGTNTNHQLKADVYTLCTGCHADQTLNHPVGRHPVRFAKIRATGEEISCVSCHNPHGSPNDHLLRAGGGRMAICLQCHDK